MACLCRDSLEDEAQSFRVLLSSDRHLLPSPPRSLQVRGGCFSWTYSPPLSLGVNRDSLRSGLGPDEDVGLGGPYLLWLGAGWFCRPSFLFLLCLSWLFFLLELEADLIRDTRTTLIHDEDQPSDESRRIQ